MKFFDEFKQFAVKGNAVDMAVAIIIGASFNKIVNSLVNDIIMPPVGLLLGGVDFKNLQVILKPETVDAAGTKLPPVALRYGLFINYIIEFLIVAFTIFVVVKLMNKLMTARNIFAPKEEKK